MDPGTEAGVKDENFSAHARRNTRVEDWLGRGGVVLAASERAARGVASDFHESRRREGLHAWATPEIYAWDRWIEDEWGIRNSEGKMLLQPLQERALWTRAIGQTRSGKAVFHRRKLADLAQQAYRLLCAYAPDSPASPARRGWTNDAAAFSEWMDEFEKLSREEDAISSSRIALELAAMLRREERVETNPPLLLIGFDRTTRAQELLLEAWGEWKVDGLEERAEAKYCAARDGEAEIQACVRWIQERLAAAPESKLMVIVPDLAERRGTLERALRRGSENESGIDFEFSLGVPLLRMSVARSAGLMLRWLSESITETELDWLLSSSHFASSAEEEAGMQAVAREIAQREWGRLEWKLEEFLGAADRWSKRMHSASATAAVSALRLRVDAARSRLSGLPVKLSPIIWSSEARLLLENLGWPGYRQLGSIAYQARERWEQVIEDCGALGFDGSLMTWSEFTDALQDACNNAVFAAESDAPRVLVTEPLESAGQLADGIWFVGADERSWPAQGQPHPLLPVGLQRSAGMPHASIHDDWKLADRVTARLLASARNVVFSYAEYDGEVETRPSRIVLKLTGECAEIEQNLTQPRDHVDRTEMFEDAALLPFPNAELSGGARSLTLQSLCPFQAFGVVRLNAEENRQSGPALSPSQRGQLLHSVMRKIWAGRLNGGVASLRELQSITELRTFVAGMVSAAMRDAFDQSRTSAFPERYPLRYLELEAERLNGLIHEWLEYERTRAPFEVVEAEGSAVVSLAGLKLKVRLDRVDALPDGSRLIVDYKTGQVNPKDWDGERPEDVQLPLYASFAVTEKLEGLVFAQVAAGDMKFKGRVRDARAKLIPSLTGHSPLLKDPLTSKQLEEWRSRIEQLARNFLDGHAEVDPKDINKTCAQCHLHAVCRIYENLPDSSWDREDEDSADGGSE